MVSLNHHAFLFWVFLIIRVKKFINIHIMMIRERERETETDRQTDR